MRILLMARMMLTVMIMPLLLLLLLLPLLLMMVMTMMLMLMMPIGMMPCQNGVIVVVHDTRSVLLVTHQQSTLMGVSQVCDARFANAQQPTHNMQLA